MKMKRIFFIGILVVSAMNLQAQNLAMGLHSLNEINEEEVFSDKQFLDKIAAVLGNHWRFVDSENVAAKYRLYGLYCVDQGNYAKAIEALNKSLELNQDLQDLNALIYSGLAVAYMQKQDYKKSIEALNKALELSQELDLELSAAIHYFCFKENSMKQYDT